MRWSSKRSLKGFGPGVPFGGGRVCARLCPRLVSSFRKTAGFPPITGDAHEVSHHISAEVSRTVTGSPCGDILFGTSEDSATGMQSLDPSILPENSLNISRTVYKYLEPSPRVFRQQSFQVGLQPSTYSVSRCLSKGLANFLYNFLYRVQSIYLLL
jgi:hypothetical protein